MSDTQTLAPIGHNSPPEPDPFEAHKIALEDDFTEARNWADGTALASQAQADELSFLIDRLRKGQKAADEARAAEKRPLDEQVKAIQAKWKPLLDKADMVIAACKRTLAPWLQALEAEKQRLAAEARRVAEEAAQKAVDAARAADPANLEEQERVEALVESARDAQKGAKRAEGDRAQAIGGSRAMSLRSVWTASMADPVAAARWAWVAHHPECEAFFLTLAEKDVRAGARKLDGFAITEERVPV